VKESLRDFSTWQLQNLFDDVLENVIIGSKRQLITRHGCTLSSEEFMKQSFSEFWALTK